MKNNKKINQIILSNLKYILDIILLNNTKIKLKIKSIK